MSVKTLKLSLFSKEAFFFLTAQALGLWVAFTLRISPQLLEFQSPLLTTSGQVGDTYSAYRFLIYFVVATIVLLVAFKFFRKSKWFFKSLLGIAIFSGVSIIFSLFMQDIYSVGLALLWVVVRFRYPRVWLHNLSIVLAVGGVGGIFGLSFEPGDAATVLGVIAVYDIIAVYFTKHMITLAKEMSKRGAIFALIIPEKLAGFWEKRDEIPAGQPGWYMLGAGDLALPLMLAASVARADLLGGVIVALFGFAGLLVMHLAFVMQSKRRPMPALPPIAVASILGWIVAVLV